MSRASQYQRFGMPKQAPEFLSPEEKAAKDAGFSSVLQQQVNRTLRNQLEQTALGKGYTDLNAIYSEAQRAAGGGDLTSNATLQKMYEYVAGKEAFKKEEVTDKPEATKVKPGDLWWVGEGEPEKSPADIAAENLRNELAGLKTDFQTSINALAERYTDLQTKQEERMTALQNQMLAAAQMRDRPTTAGVKMASGAAGNAMQIARRGVTGAFGRRGMRISSLNV